MEILPRQKYEKTQRTRLVVTFILEIGVLVFLAVLGYYIRYPTFEMNYPRLCWILYQVSNIWNELSSPSSDIISGIQHLKWIILAFVGYYIRYPTFEMNYLRRPRILYQVSNIWKELSSPLLDIISGIQHLKWIILAFVGYYIRYPTFEINYPRLRWIVYYVSNIWNKLSLVFVG